MALTAIAEVAMDKLYAFLLKQSDKVDILIGEFSDKTSTGLIKVLDELKTTNPLKYRILSENFRKIASDVEPHLAKGKFVEDVPVPATGGRKKRTTRRRKHKGTK
jgi:hypothetical protein